MSGLKHQPKPTVSWKQRSQIHIQDSNDNLLFFFKCRLLTRPDERNDPLRASTSNSEPYCIDLQSSLQLYEPNWYCIFNLYKLFGSITKS